MDRSTTLWLCGLVGGTFYLNSSYSTSWAFDRTYHSAILTLALTGALVLLCCRLFPSSVIPSNPRPEIPLHERLDPDTWKEKLPHVTRDVSNLRNTRPRFLSYLLIAAICIRVELFRLVATNPQCSQTFLEPWIPFMISLYEHPYPSENKSRNWCSGLFSRLLHAFPIFLLSLSASSAFMSVTGSRSTYICALSLPSYTWIPISQVVGFLLDVLIVILVSKLAQKARDDRTTALSVVYVGWAAILSAAILVALGTTILWWMPEHRYWGRHLSGLYIKSALKLSLWTTLTLLCALQVLLRNNAKIASVLVLFTCLCTTTIRTGWTNRQILPPISSFAVISIFGLSLLSFLLCIGMELISRSNSSNQSTRTSARFPKRYVFIVLILFLAQASIWMSRPRSSGVIHPIHSLMANAEKEHEQYIHKASASNTLGEAADAYRSRYHRDPPPGFDRWFKYAELQSSFVIDSYDGIFNDLLPFWALKPDQLRTRTWEMIANGNNSIGGIHIRKGKMSTSDFVPNTHKWMLEGVMELIKPFVKWLPDMDIAFNLNDEPRTIAPDGRIDRLRLDGLKALQKGSTGGQSFSTNRADTWKAMPNESIAETRFRDASLQHVFHRFGAIGCPPRSRARRERHWDVGSLCDHCTYEHSVQQFVSNWTLAGDPCHQPDLADLHGFYLSPASFRTAYDIMPVFSQSKVSGFNDILYPSAWNYADKVTYDESTEHPDPEFGQKKSTLFWRGSPSEGVSPSTGTWKGMARQRLVHLFTNATESSRWNVLLPTLKVLTPDDDQGPNFAYRYVPPSTLHRHLSTDVRFAGEITRCIGRDCTNQELEFGATSVPKIDFQEHWQYKYLIDVDGAGYSGRFLPFLQSRSLVFKAGLMRAWWDDRLTPWKHFVPVDVRLREMWSLLVWFAGWRADGQNVADINDNNLSKVKWLMQPHELEAVRIANAGREWAEKVLRKEDMEVYMFRLLLEWGRLTDPNRDELGFRGDLSSP